MIATARRANCHGSPAGTSYARFAPALGADANDVPRQPGGLQPADDEGRGVELAAFEAVLRGRRKRVVVVVPRLPERHEGEPRHVARLVRRLVGAPAEDVADGVDA